MKRSKLLVFMLVMMLCISVIASFVACETAKPTFGSWELVKAPTATEGGEVQRTMTTGDKEEVLKYTLPKLDDVAYTKEVVTAPTCGKDGETRYNITIAEPHYDFDGHFSFTVVEKATGAHSWSDWQVDPDDNTKEYRVCSVCAKRETRDRGHVHAFGDWAVTTAPTADAEGVITRTCSGCEEVETASIPKLNNTDYAYSETIVATCETAGEGKYSIVKDGVTLVITTTIPAIGHEYGDVVYTWSDDGKTCTAKSVCKHDASHVREENATIATAVTLEPTCTTKGKTTYTATFASDWAKSEKAITNTVEDIDATGHAYGEPIIEFSADKTTCTSTRICTHDKTHVITSTVDVTSVKTLPTCEIDGSLVYTATFDEQFGGVKTDTVVLPAIGHSYGEVVYDWTPDFSECTATTTCANDASHKMVAKSTGVRIENVAATCSNKGSTTYIASFDADWIEVARHIEYTDALPHNYGETMYIWSDDCTKCTARRVCQNNSNHIEEAVGTITSNVDKLPTCEDTGSVTYTATFSESWATTVTQPRAIAATGHQYATYRFDDTKRPTDTEVGDLIAICSVCGKETKLVGAAPAFNSGEYTRFIVKNATCLEKGIYKYAFMYEDKEIEIYEDIPVKEHDFRNVIVTTAPTELSDGEGVHVCSDCNTEETIVIPRLDKNDNVNYTYDELSSPTCQHDGVAKYRHVLYPELVFEVTLPMKPHVMSGWMVDVNNTPTFTNQGIATRSCKCGYEENRVLPALNDIDYVKEVKTSATCSMDGLETYSIVIDGETLTIEVNVPMLPHAMTPWTVILEPTTTTEGRVSRDCSNCDKMHEERDISAISVANGYVESNRVEPTSCTEAGHADYTIELYGQQFVFNNVEIPAPGHIDGDWITTSEATCSNKAVRELKCARCGRTIATENFGELKPHTYGDWEIVAPTADAAGTADITCAICYTTKHVDLPALDNIHYEYKVLEPASEGVAGTAQYIYPHEIKDIVIEVEVPALTPGHTCTTYKWIKKVDPTEQSVGSVAKVCAECGKETGETIEMPIISVDNGYKVTSTRDATCVEGGRKEMQYTLADGTVMTYVIVTEPLGHTVQEYHYYMSSDQTKAFREGICAICGTTVVEEAVSVMQGPENAPTCTMNGEILFYATFAGDIDQQIVTVELPATGHTFGEWNITRKPTLHSQGSAERQCSICNEPQNLILPTISVDNGYTRKEVKAPTCNATGLDTYSITMKGKVMSFDVEVPYLPHNYGAWQVVKVPTYDEVGLAKRTCPDCNAFEEYQLPVIHSYQYTVLSERKATCKEVGERELAIDVNDEMLIFKVELPKIEHREEDIYWRVITAPTETTEGEIVSLCRECGTELDRMPLPVLNPNDLRFYYVITLSYGDCKVPTVYQFTAVQKHDIDGKDITFKLSKLGKHDYDRSVINTIVTNNGQDAIEVKVCDRCGKMSVILNKAEPMNRAEEMPLIKGEANIDEYYNVINMLGNRPIHMSVNRAGVVKEYDILNNDTIIGEGKLTTYINNHLLTISNEGYRDKTQYDSICKLITQYIRKHIDGNDLQHLGGELFEVYDYNDELIATMNLNAHSLTIQVIEDNTTLVFSGCNRYIDITMENNLLLDKLPNMYNIAIQFIEDGNSIKTSTISYVDGETAEDLRLRMPSEMNGKPVTYYVNREMTEKFDIDAYLRSPSDITDNGLFALVGNKVTTVHVLNTMTLDMSVVRLTRDNISWTLPHEEVEGCDFVGWRMRDTREFVDVDKLMMDINANNAPSEMFVDAIYRPKTYEITRVFADRTDVYEFMYGDELDMALPPKDGNKELIGVFLDADHTIPFDEQYFSEHPQDLTIYVHYIDFSTHTHKLVRRYFEPTYEKNAREADFCEDCQREFNVKEYPGTMLDLKYYLDKNASLFKNYDYQYLGGADAIEYLVSMQGPSVGEQLAGCKIEMVIINDEMAICAGDETAMNFLMRQIRYAPYVDTNFVIAGGDFLIDAIKLIEATIVENGITYDKHKAVIIDVADDVTTLNIEASVMAINPVVMEEHDFTSITVDADNTMFKVEGSTLTDEMCVIFAWGNGMTQYDEIYYVSSAVEWLIVPSNATVVDRNGAKILTFVGPDDIISDIDPTFYIYSEVDPNTLENLNGRYYYWHIGEDGETPVIWDLTCLTFGDPIVLENDANLDSVAIRTTADNSVVKIDVTSPTEKKPHVVLYDEKKDIHSLQVFKRAVEAVNNSARMSITVASSRYTADMILFKNGFISNSEYGVEFTYVMDGMHYIYSDGVISYGEAEEYEADVKRSMIVEGMPEIILLSYLDWKVGENGTYIATISSELFNLICYGRTEVPQDFVPTKPEQIMTFILTISEDGVYTILHKEAGNIPRFKYVIEENAIRLSNEGQTIVVHDIDGYQDISFVSGIYNLLREPFTIELVDAGNNENINSIHYDMNVNTKEDLMKKLVSPNPKIEFLGLYDDSAMTTPFDIDAYIATPCNRIIYVKTKSLVFTEGAFKGMADSNIEMFNEDWIKVLADNSYEITENGKVVGYGADRKSYNVEKNIYNEMLDYNTFKAYEYIDGEWLIRTHHDDILYDPMQLSELLYMVYSSGYRTIERGVFETTGDKFPTPVRITIVSTAKESKVTVTSGKNTMIYTFGVDRVVTLPEGAIENPNGGGMVGPPPPPGPGPGPKPVPGPGPIPVAVDNELIA